MAAILTVLIAIGDEGLITIGTNALIICLLVNLVLMCVPPGVSTLIRTEAFFLPSGILYYRYTTVFTGAYLCAIYLFKGSHTTQTISLTVSFNTVDGNLHCI
jgi:hypothetical protein